MKTPKSRFRHLVSLIALCILSAAQSAFADKICLRSLLRNGKIIHKTRIAAGTACPKGYAAILDSTEPEAAALLAGPQGPQGTQGPQGPQGVQGIQGPQGLPGYTGISISYGESVSDSNSPKIAFAECPLGTQVIGGMGGVVDGLEVVANLPVAVSYASVPIFSNSFAVRAFETSAVASTWRVTAFALCIPK